MSAFTPARARKVVAVLLVNLVAVLILLEVAGLVYLYVRDGVLFYPQARQKLASPAPERVDGAGTNVLHPVLGFIRPPRMPLARIMSRERLDRTVGTGVTPNWLSLEANNYGFFAVEDYPYVPAGQKDEYLIGVFGGSVAQWFALQAAERLGERLQESDLLRGRSLRVLSFAQGAFKQPQQLHTLAYFLALGQRFDFVINIDGLNEVALSYGNVTRNVDGSLPSAQQLLPIIALLDRASASGAYLDTLAALKENHQRTARLTGLMERNPSAAAQVLLERLHRTALGRYWASAERLDGLSAGLERTPLIHVNESELSLKSATEQEVFRHFADTWMRSSMLMSDLLLAGDVPYLHVLQPNQYYSRGRHFSLEERALAIDPGSPYRFPAEQGYPNLLDRLRLLRGHGVDAATAVGVFDGARETVYSDSCCHYNQRGNELLADFVADLMIPRIEGIDLQLSARLAAEAERP